MTLVIFLGNVKHIFSILTTCYSVMYSSFSKITCEVLIDLLCNVIISKQYDFFRFHKKTGSKF